MNIEEFQKMSGEAKIIFEGIIKADGFAFYVIYGKYSGGHFLCIPDENFHIGCNMSSPDDTFYNLSSLIEIGVSSKIALALAYGIRDAIKSEVWCEEG